MARVLYLSSHSLYPTMSGGRYRELQLLRRLANDHQICFVGVSKTRAADERYRGRMLELFSEVRLFDACPTRAHNSQVPPQWARNSSPQVRSCIQNFLSGVDLVHAEGFYMLAVLPERLDVPLVLGAQNIEYELFQQQARVATVSEAAHHWRPAVLPWQAPAARRERCTGSAGT